MNNYLKPRFIKFAALFILLLSTLPCFPQQVQLKKEEYRQSMLEKYSSYLSEGNEIRSLRTSTSQHYRVDKNLYIALIYSTPSRFINTDNSLIKIAGDTTIVAPASGRVFKDGVNLTKYDNGLRIQNTDDSGCENGYRSWVKFDISNFPDSTNALWIEQHIYCTELVEDFFDYLNYNIQRIDNEPVNASPFDLWTDINDGAAYELDEWVSNPPDWEWCLLNVPAASDFTAAIDTSDWFGLGYMVKCDEDNSSFYAVFKGALDDLPPYLVIGYNYIVNVEDIEPRKSYTLYQNYPNPFNSSTMIKYQIPELSFITLNIYDVLGNEIETLVNEEKPAGTYELLWNATNLPTGVYIYRIKARDPSTGSGQVFIHTKKMLLLK